MKIILASGSPRRKEILTQAGLEFEVLSADHEEKSESRDPEEFVKELAKQKADAAVQELKKRMDGESFLVIGADTVVSLNGAILGKPKDEKDAFSMLSFLQGNVHQVYTGVCMEKLEQGKERQTVCFAQKTDVKVAAMEQGEIEAYIATKEPMDKAGSYAIQGRFGRYIEEISGDYYNVVGFPICRFFEELKKQMPAFLDKADIPC